MAYTPDPFLHAFNSQEPDAPERLRALIVNHDSAQRFIRLYVPTPAHELLLEHAASLLTKPATLGFVTYPEVVNAILVHGKGLNYGAVPFSWTREIIAAHQRIQPIPGWVMNSISLMGKRDPQLVEMLMAADPSLKPHRESLAQYRYLSKPQAFAREAIERQPHALRPALETAFSKVLSGEYDDITLREAYLLQGLGLGGICIYLYPDYTRDYTPDVCEMVLDTQRNVFRSGVDPRVEKHYLATRA